MIDDQAIRNALVALADDAPPADRIRASLAGRARRHRQRRLILRVAGAGAAAATTGIAAAGGWHLTRPPERGFPVLAGGPGGGWLAVPLRFRPGWLPHPYGEASRSLIVAGTRAPVLSRVWQRPGTTDQPISLLVGWHPSLDSDRPTGPSTTVDIHGVAGEVVQLDERGPSTYLTWQPAGQPQLIVSVLTRDALDAQHDLAVRVARSVRPDPGHTWVGPRFGWLPPDLTEVPWRLGQWFQNDYWTQDAVVNTSDAGRQLSVTMGTGPARRPENTPTSPIRIREFSGWLVPEYGQLYLTLLDGIEVFAQLDAAPGGENVMPSLIRIMEEFDFGPWPDLDWVGKR